MKQELQLFQRMIELIDGRIPIICGVGTNDTRDSVAFVKRVSDNRWY